MVAATAKIHWIAPSYVLSGLFGGILFAVGHHLYYASLAGASAESDRYVVGHRLSGQQFAIAVGTAFAFIVRACLLFSIATAYIQAFWQAFWRAAQNPKKPNTLEDTDALLSAPSNLLAFRKGSVWVKYPLLLLIGLIGWLLPIAFLVPPATLSVTFAPRTSSALQYVPNLDFTSLRYPAGMPRAANILTSEYGDDMFEYYARYQYNGPSIEVQKVATSVAAGGNILPIVPPAPNSSWGLDFYGPSISCGPMNDGVKLQVQQNIAHWLWNESTSGENCFHPYGYLAWSSNSKFPSVSDAANAIPAPFINDPTSNSTIFSPGFHLGPFSPLYMAIMPSMFRTMLMSTHYSLIACLSVAETTEALPLGPEDMTFLQCDLHNASYHAEFEYMDGTQTVSVEAARMEALDTIESVLGPWVNTYRPSDPEVELECFRLTPTPQNEGTEEGPCTFEPNLLRSLSYTAVLDAFRRVIMGSVSIDSSLYLAADTNVVSTALLNTPELDFIRTGLNGDYVSLSLQSIFRYTNTSRGQSLSDSNDLNVGQPLQDALEEMFQNITVSLMSSAPLQPNISSEFAPPKTNVSITTYAPIFIYSTGQLWLAYGIATLVSLVASTLGFWALRSNGASFTSDFSTIYRVAYCAVLDVFINPEDMDGSDPLPKHLAKARISLMSGQVEYGGGNGDASVSQSTEPIRVDSLDNSQTRIADGSSAYQQVPCEPLDNGVPAAIAEQSRSDAIPGGAAQDVAQSSSGHVHQAEPYASWEEYEYREAIYRDNQAS